MWAYKSYRCLPGLAGDCWAVCCWAGRRCARWSGIITPSRCYELASGMESCMTSPSGQTPAPLTGGHGEAGLTFSQQASRASRLVSLASARPAQTRAMAGRIPRAYWERSGQGLPCWKTCQASLPLSAGDTLAGSSMRWPRWGMTQGGVLWELPALELHTKEIAGGVYLPTPSASRYGRNKSPSAGASEGLSLDTMAARGMWPTPTVSGNHNRKGASPTSGDGLATAVLKRGLWATPTAHDAKDTGTAPSEGRRNSPCLAYQAGGKLNPTWVEWLMGWPLGQTDLKPLEMGRFQQWQQHGSFLAGLTLMMWSE